MTCHDCGKPAQSGRLIAVVGNERRAYCQTHGELRWDMGGPRPRGWLRGTEPCGYYTGPIENKD